MEKDAQKEVLPVNHRVQVLDGGMWFNATVKGHQRDDDGNVVRHLLSYSRPGWMKVTDYLLIIFCSDTAVL